MVAAGQVEPGQSVHHAVRLVPAGGLSMLVNHAPGPVADCCVAQVGSLVPADSARLHVLDAIHTRMGASDNLAMGRSTFLEVPCCCHMSHAP